MEYIEELRKYVGTNPVIACGANVILIDEDEKILLHLRKDNNSWGLPGGMMELGESTEENAIREVYEETGLTCHSLELFNIYSGKKLYYKYPDGNEVYNVTVTYLCRNYSGEIKVDLSEGYEVKYFAVNDIPDRLSGPIVPILNEYCEKVIKSSNFYNVK